MKKFCKYCQEKTYHDEDDNCLECISLSDAENESDCSDEEHDSDFIDDE